jgi:ribosome-binding protein aMBF1 (putative translation factor)
MAKYREKHVSLPAAQRRRLHDKAKRIDREEQAVIKAQAKRVKARAKVMRTLAATLKGERERRGLSLAEVSSRSGIDKAALSRFENAGNLNPQLDTLLRYAEAIGAELRIDLKPAA